MGGPGRFSRREVARRGFACVRSAPGPASVLPASRGLDLFSRPSGCFPRPEVALVWTVDAFDVDFLKWDFNRSFTDAGSLGGRTDVRRIFRARARHTAGSRSVAGRTARPPTPSTPAIALWNRKPSGTDLRVYGFGLAVTHPPHHLCGIHLREAVLDGEPVHRVGVVRRPRLVRPCQARLVDPPSASRARLDPQQSTRTSGPWSTLPGHGGRILPAGPACRPGSSHRTRTEEFPRWL